MNTMFGLRGAAGVPAGQAAGTANATTTAAISVFHGIRDSSEQVKPRRQHNGRGGSPSMTGPSAKVKR
jgi:hypothetical protein